MAKIEKSYPKRSPEVEKLKDFWKPYFKEDFYYYPKKVFKGSISIREYELNTCGEWIYTEYFLGKAYNVNEPRVLYRLKVGEDFKDSYTRSTANIPGVEPFEEFIVPITELEQVFHSKADKPVGKRGRFIKMPSDTIGEPELETRIGKLPDEYIGDRTHRDDFCEKNLIPLTNKPWLNELIIEARKMNFGDGE